MFAEVMVIFQVFGCASDVLSVAHAFIEFNGKWSLEARNNSKGSKIDYKVGLKGTHAVFVCIFIT